MTRLEGSLGLYVFDLLRKKHVRGTQGPFFQKFTVYLLIYEAFLLLKHQLLTPEKIRDFLVECDVTMYYGQVP